MQKMLVVVFDDETKAYQGSSAIKDLDNDGSISVHALAVVMKNPDGSLTTKEITGDYPVRTLEGTAIGALIGVLGGPIGVAIGASSGMLAGSILDVDRADATVDYVDQVRSKLTPGKWAVVADISEEWEKLQSIQGWRRLVEPFLEQIAFPLRTKRRQGKRQLRMPKSRI